MKRGVTKVTVKPPVVTKHFQPTRKNDDVNAELPYLVPTDEEEGEIKKRQENLKRERIKKKNEIKKKEIGKKEEIKKGETEDDRKKVEDNAANVLEKKKFDVNNSKGAKSKNKKFEDESERKSSPKKTAGRSKDKAPKEKKTKSKSSSAGSSASEKLLYKSSMRNLDSDSDDSRPLKRKVTQNNLEGRIRANIENINERSQFRLSLLDCTCKKGKVSTSCSKENSQRCDCSYVTLSYIEKLKDEIKGSKMKTPCGIMQNVSELRQEIAQYRTTLNDKVSDALVRMNKLEINPEKFKLDSHEAKIDRDTCDVATGLETGTHQVKTGDSCACKTFVDVGVQPIWALEVEKNVEVEICRLNEGPDEKDVDVETCGLNAGTVEEKDFRVNEEPAENNVRADVCDATEKTGNVQDVGVKVCGLTEETENLQDVEAPQLVNTCVGSTQKINSCVGPTQENSTSAGDTPKLITCVDPREKISSCTGPTEEISSCVGPTQKISTIEKVNTCVDPTQKVSTCVDPAKRAAELFENVKKCTEFVQKVSRCIDPDEYTTKENMRETAEEIMEKVRDTVESVKEKLSLYKKDEPDEIKISLCARGPCGKDTSSRPEAKDFGKKIDQKLCSFRFPYSLQLRW